MKNSLTNRLLRGCARSLVVMFVFIYLAGAASAMQNDEGESSQEADKEEGSNPRQQVEELGETLKAAVMSGAMSEEEARRVWATMIVRLKENAATANAKAGAEESKREALAADPKASFGRLAAPRPMQVRVLLQPEFQTRDLIILRDELNLDRNQMVVAEMFIKDYLEAIDLASTPLREALKNYRRARTGKWLSKTLERVQPSDPDVAVVKIERALEQIVQKSQERIESANDEDRAKFEAWQQRMIAVTSELDERLKTIRNRVRDELADLERDGAAITADDLVRIAKELRIERGQLRMEITESLEALTNNEQRGHENKRFEATMARFRTINLLPSGRLAGESINLWAALDKTQHRNGNAGDLGEVEAMLEERATSLAAVLDDRTQATLDREISGLEFQAKGDRFRQSENVPDQLARAIRPFATAARREITASLVVRNMLLALLDESSAYIEDVYPDSGLSEIYREAALGYGFPVEMRKRWAEVAIDAALKLENLDDDMRDTLLSVQSQKKIELAQPRNDAIIKRILRDPKLAREQIDAQFEGGSQELRAEYGPELWLGINYQAFSNIDDRTESILRAILTTEQFDMLPPRKSASAKSGKG